MKIPYQKALALIATTFLLAVPAFSVSAENDKEAPTPIVLVAEPSEISDGVYYVDNGKNLEPSAFTWVEGGSDGKGTALELNGQTQFIRLSTDKTKELREFTLSAWFKAYEGSEADQSFLLSVFQQNPAYHLTVSPFSEDAQAQRNGIHLVFNEPNNENVSLFHTTAYPVSSALPTGEWHHFAVRLSAESVSLYIDGAKYAEKTLENFLPEATVWHRFILGGNIQSQGAFKGLVDETYLYTEALDDNQIGLLAAGYEPKPDVVPPTQKEYIAIRPITEIPNTAKESVSVLGLSPSLFTMIGAVLTLVLVLVLVISSYRKRQQIVPEEDHL